MKAYELAVQTSIKWSFLPSSEEYERTPSRQALLRLHRGKQASFLGILPSLLTNFVHHPQHHHPGNHHHLATATPRNSLAVLKDKHAMSRNFPYHPLMQSAATSA